MDTKALVLVKLGGSAITDKSRERTVQKNILQQLARELKTSKTPLLISHGAGSFAHRSAKRYGGKKGYESTLGIAHVASDVRELNFLVTKALLDVGLAAVSISPMSMMLTSKGTLFSHHFTVIEEMLQQNLIPVVYGDVLWDKTWNSTIYSGETTLNSIAIHLKSKGYNIKQVIQVGNTSGVYDTQGKTIPTITKTTWRHIKSNVSSAYTIDVTGGMRHKVEEALKLQKYGIPTILINGIKKLELLHALKGENIQATFIK